MNLKDDNAYLVELLYLSGNIDEYAVNGRELTKYLLSPERVVTLFETSTEAVQIDKTKVQRTLIKKLGV